MDRKRAAERRARESQSEREHRLALGRQRAAERRAAESEEEREHRLAQNRERLATRRASKAEKLNLGAAATRESGGPLSSMEMNGHGRMQLRMHQPAPMFCGGQLQELEQAGLTAKITSDPLLPVGVIEVEMASASASVVQPQLEQQQMGAVAEQTAAPSTSGASGGGEKINDLKQEILEIKEFRAGT